MASFKITVAGLYLTRGGLAAEVFPDFDWIVSGVVNGKRMQWFRDDGFSLGNDKSLDLVSRFVGVTA